MRPSHPRLTLLAMVSACQAPASGSSGFSTAPVITTASASSTDDSSAVDSSSGPGPGSNSMSAGSTSSESGAESTTQPVLDLGTMPDLGDGKPVGCKGKIDLLFVISRDYLMDGFQTQLIGAFPNFIETIKSKFSDFDYHIMVIDGDDEWGAYNCNEGCLVQDCKVGDACCSVNHEPKWLGKPCCDLDYYPCEYLDVLPDCETRIGAGTLFPAGHDASNKLCPIDGGRRYMTKGQKNLTDTFACVAQIGTAGSGKLGEALTAAMQNNINGPGGCNDGFIREDALLMVTFIGANPDSGGGGTDSDGYAEDWAKAVLDAKHGDPDSVVMLRFANPDWEPYDEIWKMAKMFPYMKVDRADVDDYSPAFEEATALVETACAGFVAPG